MFANHPECWDENLSGHDRYRFIVNTFTRMRFCTKLGELELTTKGGMDACPNGYQPWFRLANRMSDTRVFFGHWAALLGNTGSKQFINVDTGCMWGKKLSAYRLDDDKIFSVDSGVNKR